MCIRDSFGDDCDQRRSSRVPNDDGSAFSGDNLDSKLKNQYYDRLEEYIKENEQKYYDNYADDFNYDDYEYDDASYDDRYNNNNNNNYNNNSKKRRRAESPFSSQSYSDKRSQRPNRNSQGNQRNRNVSHPLDYPRSTQQNMNSSRYGSGQRDNSRQTANYKSYNSFKPFRSGTLRR